MTMALNVQAWAEQQFAACEIGDKLRVKRMVKVAVEAAAKPNASTPKQTENWADCKGAFRLFACAQVTFEAVTAPHYTATRAAAQGVCLILNDTTEINYGYRRTIRGMGRVGSAQSSALYLHSALMVNEAGEMVGMAAQELYKRRWKKVRRVSSASRKKLPRETGSYTMQVQANKKQVARTATPEVRCAQILMPFPQTGTSDYVQATGIQEIPMWIVEARQVHPPHGTPALRWVLLTHERSETFGDAWRVIEWYERRPLVEEYHKCLKTGCRVEQREYHDVDHLEAVIGSLSIGSVRLLQLKTIGRQEPERLAKGVVPSEWLATLPLVLKRKRPLNTVRDFMHALASLCGFLARKSDGEPGWQTIWHGLETLLFAIRTRKAMKNCG